MGLELRRVLKLYSDFRLELDFQVRPGELLILLGPSGCGKTTTLRMVAGFIAPDEGEILMDGRRIDGLPPDRRGIGIVFQDYALFPHLSVADNVAFGPHVQGWGRARRAARVEELLALVSLAGYGRRKVTRLSGGEQQRVALARALAPNPRLLLLDEPLSALDAKLRQGLRGEIRRIQQELGLTTVYVTHDQEEALALADRIAVMRDGRIEQIDAPKDLYRRPRSLFVASFLGRANLVPARISGREGEHLVVQTPVGRFRADGAACERAASGAGGADRLRGETETLRGGAEATLFFRPESCELHPRDERLGANGARGVVRRVEYLGSRQLLEVEAGGLRLTLDLPGRDSFAVGEPVGFSVPPERCCLLPR
ncbi:MAG: ABC transporter ATP-binding protein [Spirochaetales bacterium]|nr:ABC transporter ATP-binding protein [Spirochaetales bacterium]